MFFRILLAITVSISAVAFALPAGSVQAQDLKLNTCTGANLKLESQSGGADATGCASTAAADQTALNTLITNIVNLFSIIVGVVAVIMIIYGGFRYITSGGDSGNIGTAKNTIIYALVGLVIVALAQVIVRFVLQKATGGST